MDALREPLEESAPLARAMAPRLCRKDPRTGEDCSWTHGVWQHLRLLGLVGSNEAHAEFYARALSGLAFAGPAPRVLICGAADYFMLALVIGAFRARAIEPDVTVVDVCETPLALNRWYAKRVSISIETDARDVLDYRASAPFDAICAHSFLGYFARAERPRLFASWRASLRPGGAVIAVNPIRPETTQAKIGFTREQALAFRAETLRRAELMRDRLTIDPAELAAQAELYAAKHSTHTLRSNDELGALLEECGFALEQLTTTPVAPGALSGGGPSSRGASGHARVIATRS